jgi:hypothetical protein
VLLDDREQVAEQAALLIGQLRAIDRFFPGSVFDPIDLSPSARQQRSARTLSVGGGTTALPVGSPIAGAARSAARRGLRPA